MRVEAMHPKVWQRLRWVVWSGAAVLLALPWMAMRVTDEVQWSATDFLVMALLLTSVASVYELAVRVSRSDLAVIAAAVAAGNAFLIAWVNLAVGMLADPCDAPNIMFFGVIAIAAIGALLARFRSPAMATAMIVAAVAQAATVIAAWKLGTAREAGLIACFIVPWALSAWLYRLAARRESVI